MNRRDNLNRGRGSKDKFGRKKEDAVAALLTRAALAEKVASDMYA